jgi:hypothetical protein
MGGRPIPLAWGHCYDLFHCFNPSTTEERVMNKDQLLGNMKIAMGRLEENLAGLMHDQTHLRHAAQLLHAGKVQRTMGEARQLIKRSLKQHMSA